MTTQIQIAIFATLCTAALYVPAATFGQTVKLPDLGDLRAQLEMPDPMILLNGQKVKNSIQWTKERRPELKQLFQHYMYGYFPPKVKILAQVEREDTSCLGGKATLREVTLRPGDEIARPINLLLVIPNHRTKPAPIFLGIAFCGTQAVLSDPKIRMSDGWAYPGPGVKDNRATEASRGSAVDVWNIEQSIDRGYAVAVFYNGDVEPDVNGNTDGIRYKAMTDGRKEFGAIAAWAWGIHRVIDYLVTVKEIDKEKISVVGHSRNGKATLLAAAFDERIALAIPLQAGCGGTAPSRGKVGESVKQINTSFPHWFNETFKQFNDRAEFLPFDQDGLVALCAPRPVLFANATEDTWANPAGQFEVLKAADGVYKFLGTDGLGATSMPGEGKLVKSRLGYFIRPGKHSMTKVDWQAFLDFADAHLGKPAVASR